MRGGDEGMLSVEISTLRPTNVIYLDDSETMERLFKVCSRKANRCVELGDPIRARKFRCQEKRALCPMDGMCGLLA
jgi:hypothetical protein